MLARLNKNHSRTLALSLLLGFAPLAHADLSQEERFKAVELRLNQLEEENRALQTQAQNLAQRGAWAAKTTFGSYGELHLNKPINQKPNGSANKNDMDFHRFVLFMSHEYNDDLRFFSELEIEHGVTKDTSTGSSTGLVVLEQAYLDFKLNDMLSAKAGLMLMPIGIISETHEPATFYGVERNPIETKIIPTTWQESGMMLSAKLGSGLSLDGAITTGFLATSAKDYAVRDARQGSAIATAKDAAYTVRIKWSAIPGVELAGSAQLQTDISQGADTTTGAATLYETHAIVNQGAFGLRALYAQWNLSGSGPQSKGADKQNGWYVEPSWKFTEKWGIFARHNEWDNKAGDSNNSRYQQVDVGVNYWPHPDVVIKLDHQNQTSPAGQDEYDGFNVGLGYQF